MEVIRSFSNLLCHYPSRKPVCYQLDRVGSGVSSLLCGSVWRKSNRCRILSTCLFAGGAPPGAWYHDDFPMPQILAVLSRPGCLLWTCERIDFLCWFIGYEHILQTMEVYCCRLCDLRISNGWNRLSFNGTTSYPSTRFPLGNALYRICMSGHALARLRSVQNSGTSQNYGSSCRVDGIPRAVLQFIFTWYVIFF